MRFTKEELAVYKRFLILIVLSVVVVAGIKLFMPEQADETALAAMKTDALVEVSDQPSLIALVPKDIHLQRGLIFYQGAKVPPEAYVPLLKPLAEQGILIVIPKMPLNFAIFGIDRAAEIQNAYPQITCWTIAGHSLGGSMAAEYARENSYRLNGIIFLGSYPAKNTSLMGMDMKGLVIRGSNDGLATAEDIKKVLQNYPSDTIFIEIEGGNHAQFGNYGLQSGDDQATIDWETQQADTDEAILDFIFTLGGTCADLNTEP
jgi:hypothetical protein